MAAAWLDPASLVNLAIEEFDDGGIVGEPPLLATAAKDLLIHRARRIRHMDLETDASEEGVVHQLPRFEVRREDDERIEGEREFLPRVKGEVIHALLQRDDPPVEQVAWAHELTAEIVEDEDAAVGLHLWRCLVVL